MFGHCNNCWWWKKLNTQSNGMCFFQMNLTEKTSYCPDYYNRAKGNKDECLDEWLKRHPEINIEEE